MNRVQELPAPEVSSEPLSPASEKPAFLGKPLGDRVFTGIVTLFGLTVLGVPALMVIELLRASTLSIGRFGLAFLTTSTWDPVHEQFGALPFIYGTVVSSIIALCIAVPIALGLAIFLSDLAPHKIRKPLGFMVELLAAIPSVVYGFWGVFVLVPLLRETVEPFLIKRFGFLPLFQGEPLGFGMLAAGIILAIMIVPTITSISREVLQAVPQTHREAAIGLGATPLHGFDPHRGVDQDPTVRRGQQHVPAGHRTQNVIGRAGGATVGHRQIGAQREPGRALAGHQRRQHVGVVEHQRGQRAGRHRTGHQRGGGLVDHRAQIGHRRPGTAVLLGHRDPEQAEFGQTGIDRPPGVGLTVLDVAAGGDTARPGGPVANQLTRGGLLGRDGSRDPRHTGLLDYLADEGRYGPLERVLIVPAIVSQVDCHRSRKYGVRGSAGGEGSCPTRRSRNPPANAHHEGVVRRMSSPPGRESADPDAKPREVLTVAVLAESELGSEAQRERRKRILDATMAIASKGGYEAVQMRAVADRADVAVGTLYRYFPSKVHLLVSALGREFERIDAKTDRTVVAGGTSYQRLSFMVNKLNRAMQRNPLLTEAMTRAYVFADASAAAT